MKNNTADTANPWLSDDLTERWLKFFSRNPFGDLYRLWLVNPAVVQLAITAARRKLHASKQENDASAAKPGHVEAQIARVCAEIPPLELGLAIQTQHLGELMEQLARASDRQAIKGIASKVKKELLAWHKQVVQHGKEWKPLEKLRVLDLGCGVGYRAGFLTALGASYYGVDVNRKFIAEAKRRHKGATFTELDLDSLDGMSPEAASAKLLGLCGGVAPDLVLGIFLVEQLKAATSLIRGLQHLMSGNRTSVMLVTINHYRYYHQFAIPTMEGEPVAEWCKRPEKVPIICLKKGVRVPIEQFSHFELSSILRDSGFLIQQEALLSLPPGGDGAVMAEYEAAHTDVNWGVAPFRGFVVTPWPNLKPVPTDERQKLCVSNAEGSQFPFSEPDGISDAQAVELKPGEHLLMRHNLGGCLLIVAEGWVHIPHEPEIHYRPFQILGELEANHNYADTSKAGSKLGLFISDVVAGDAGAKVVVIPPNVASRLIAPPNSFLSMLFAELRRRVLLRNLRLTNRSSHDKALGKSSREEQILTWRLGRRQEGQYELDIPLSRSSCRAEHRTSFFLKEETRNPFAELSISKQDLGHLAGALLQLSEIERDELRRCEWCHCILVNSKALMDITEIKEESTISEFLRILSRLNVADAFPVSGFSEISGCDGLSLKKHIISSTKAAILKRLNDSMASTAENVRLLLIVNGMVEKWFESRDAGRWWNVQPKMRRTKSAQRKRDPLASAYRQLEAELRNTNNLGDALKATALQMLELLASMDLLLESPFPYFVVLHDLPMLRSLAFDPDDDLERLLFARGLVCRARLPKRKGDRLPGLEELPRKLEAENCHGRIRMYAAAFCEFFAHALKSPDPVLKFSTNTESVPRPSPASVKLSISGNW